MKVQNFRWIQEAIFSRINHKILAIQIPAKWFIYIYIKREIRICISLSGYH